MTTLYASVIHLVAEHEVRLEKPGGQHAHAAFLELVREIDPELAGRLHDTNGRKPFTTSPLMTWAQGGRGEMGPALGRRESVTLPVGWEGWLRVTLLDEALFRVFIDHFLFGAARPRLRLGDGHFLVKEVLTTPGSHSWAGVARSEDLRGLLDVPAPQRLGLRLATPTAFSLGDERVATFPSPDLVFMNLARAWEGLGEDHGISSPLRDYVNTQVLAGAYRLHTEPFLLQNQTQLGAVGEVEYVRLDGTDHPLGRALNLLTQFAFFAGLGRKTAMGMGMVRPEEPLKGARFPFGEGPAPERTAEES
jgi:CRISPR-associated endoribonuclease Cas6